MTHIQIIDLQTTLNVEETDTMKQISKIRYDVFCEELKLYPENNQKLSQDNYDSVYIVYKLLGSVKVVGFVSITIPTSKEKSIMKYVKDDIVNTLGKFFELRILTVIKEYRTENNIVYSLISNALLYCLKFCPCNMVIMARKDLVPVYMKYTPFEKFADGVVNREVELIPLKINVTTQSLNAFILRIDKNADISDKVCKHGLGQSLNVRFPLDVLDAVYKSYFYKNPFDISYQDEFTPDVSYTKLRDSIGAVYNLDKNNVIVGCGSSQLIFSGLQSLFTINDTVSILNPTYEEYEYVLENIVNCKINKIDIMNNNQVVSNLEEYIVQQVINSKSIGLCIVSPNSPIPVVLDIVKLISLLPTKIIVWIDETYYPFYNFLKTESATFSSITPTLISSDRNIILCRSMSKLYGLSGCRIGYCLANNNIVKLMKKYIPPWSVNRDAESKAIFIHNNMSKITQYYNIQLKELIESKNKLCCGIKNIVDIIEEENSINYIFFYNDTPHFEDILLNNGIKVRSYSNFNKYYRIAVPHIKDVDELVNSFTSIKF